MKRWLLCAAILFVGAEQTEATSYRFARIADNIKFFPQFSYGFSMNDAGQVAFIAGLDIGSRQIFISDGITTAAVENSGEFKTLLQPIINNNGQVAFLGATESSGARAYRSDGSTLTTIWPYSRVFGLSMNDSGTVAFTAEAPSGYRAVYVGDGSGPVALVAEESAFGSGRFEPDSLGPCVINANEMVAITAHQLHGTEIFVSDEKTIRHFYTGPGDLNPYAAVDMNDGGTIACWGTHTSGKEGILVSDGTSVRVFDDYGYGHTEINNSGQVAWNASHVGIFCGPDFAEDAVIRRGDSLDGSIALLVDMPHTRSGLNNNGQIAFYAELADGRSGLYRADPIPEPSSLALASLGALSLVGIRWRRKRR